MLYNSFCMLSRHVVNYFTSFRYIGMQLRRLSEDLPTKPVFAIDNSNKEWQQNTNNVVANVK